jgi:ABC-2 type transport system permease protein
MTAAKTASLPVPAPGHGAALVPASLAVAARTMRKFARTPQLIAASTISGAMFLVLFRYVFGGAITGLGGLPYVDFMVPGFVTTAALFSGMGASAGIAEDRQAGLYDRLRSLPAPRLSLVCGRVLADTTLTALNLAFSIGIGFALGFRIHASAAHAAAGFGLCLLYGFAFCWVFAALGLLAGNPQAAQGLSFLVFPLAFVSDAYIPAASMPGWLQAFAAHQPLTAMTGTVRMLTEGHPAGPIPLTAALAWTAGLIISAAPIAVWQLRRT